MAVGVATLGALLESRVAAAFSTTTGDDANALGRAVSSAGLRAVAGRPDLVQPAKSAFTSGLNTVLLTGVALLVVGALSALVFIRGQAPAAPSD